MTLAPLPPPYAVTFEDRDRYLYARVSGPRDTFAISLDYWNEVARVCRARGYQRMLVVQDFPATVSLGEIFDVAERLPGILRGIRVAFVDEHIAHMSANKFGEDVAVNRGTMARVFSDPISAGAWLSEP